MPTTSHSRFVARRFFPLLATGRAAARRVEHMPNMPTGAGPSIGGGRFPIAFWAGYFYFGHFFKFRFPNGRDGTVHGKACSKVGLEADSSKHPQIEKPGFSGARNEKAALANEVRLFVFLEALGRTAAMRIW